MVTISPESVNVMYGSTVTLTCEVQSLTTPTVTWTSNTDVDLTFTSLVSSNDTHTSILTLEQVTLEYIGEYTCTAVNEGGESSDMINVNVYGKNMSLSIYLSMYLFIYPLVCIQIFMNCTTFISCIVICLSFIITIFSSLSLLVPETVNPLQISITTTGSQEIGSTYTLQCIVTSVNTPMIIWKNSTDIISDTSAGIEVGNLVDDGDTWSVTLTFNPLRQSHEEEYVCFAFMNFDESDITNETITVDVISESLYICLSIY